MAANHSELSTNENSSDPSSAIESPESGQENHVVASESVEKGINQGPLTSSLTLSPSALSQLEKPTRVEVAMAKGTMEGGSAKPPSSPWKGFGGILLAILASLCFTLVTVIIKVLSENSHYDHVCLAVYRFGGAIVPVIPIIIYKECQGFRMFDPIWPISDPRKCKHFIWLSLCGVLASGAKIIRLSSLAYISVADSSAILFASPVCVVILAHFCLKEKCGFVSMATALLTCLGVFVISRPPALTGSKNFDPNTLMGTGLAGSGMLANAVALILMRELRHMHFTLLNIAFTFWGVAEALGVSLARNTMTFPVGIYDIILVVLVLPALTFQFWASPHWHWLSTWRMLEQ